MKPPSQQRRTARQHLRELLNLRWLSVHHAPVRSGVREEKSYDSTVDVRLEQVCADFVRYSSSWQTKTPLA
jgi:hypothetical protein